MVQRAGSGMRLISSCVQRKRMGLLAAPGCMGPPRWCQSHPHCPLAPTTLQMKTVNSAGVCCLLCSVTSNKAPRLPASLGRSIGKTDTHTHGHFLILVWGPEEYTGGGAMLLESPIVHRASSSSAEKTHTWSHSTHRASFPTPDYSVPAVIFPGKELK